MTTAASTATFTLDLPRPLSAALSGHRRRPIYMNGLMGNIPARANSRLKQRVAIAALTGGAAYGVGALLQSRMPRPVMSEEQKNAMGWSGLGLTALGATGMIAGNVVIDKGTDMLRMGRLFPNVGFRKSGWTHVGLGMLGSIAGAVVTGRGLGQILASQRAVVPSSS